MDASVLQWQCLVAETEAVWFPEPKPFALWLFTESLLTLDLGDGINAVTTRKLVAQVKAQIKVEEQG